MRNNAMTIHLVGETIDAKQAHLRAQASELIPLLRGVYVTQGTDVDQTVMAHAVRIAHYIYPRAYLSSAAPFFGHRPKMGGCSSAAGGINVLVCARLRSFKIRRLSVPLLQRPSSVTILVNFMCKCPPHGSVFSNPSG
jgi:hypothetical protein